VVPPLDGALVLAATLSHRFSNGRHCDVVIIQQVKEMKSNGSK
jgi:hypothetical protein